MTMDKDVVAPGNEVIRFADAELDLGARELRVRGKRAALGPRGFGLLKMLVEQRARAVSKHELLDTVWRGVIVEENNLQVQISFLRRLLGAQAIATIPGRGYRFVLPVDGGAEAAAPLTPVQPPAEPTVQPVPEGNLPSRLPELYGREAECATVLALVQEHALVSIVGAAGIGKTRLALATAQACELAGTYPDGVWLVELAVVNDPRLLVETIAQAMRVMVPGRRDPAEELAAALRGRRALLVVDNCEHLIEDIGPLVVQLLRETGTLHVLATTQEPLRVGDEHLYRLAPLSVPPDPASPDAADYGAVRLFVERVRALQPHLTLTGAHLGAAVEICRRLDGLPLAIELAAARVPMLGVTGVEERLGERFRVLTGGSRFAPKRHQTLRAALDWSHALLNEDERAVYRRLGVFVGGFSLENAQDLAASEAIDAWAVLEHLSSLVEKSLVLAEGEPRPRYRMLESTREHALEQLAGAGETDRCIARHAEVTWRGLERDIRQRRNEAVHDELGNIRSAYDWARGPQGNPVAAVALATLPAMMIAVEGSAHEARQRLVDVEPLVDESLPQSLVAQYWQWYGRIGVNGRLPARRCIEALQRAEALFIELGNLRHVHACRRHLAEALLDGNDVDGAAAALQRARSMEDGRLPVADRMRRLRVEGLWLAKAGRLDEALKTSLLALDMARQARIERYVLVLLDDLARMHLEGGHAREAAEQYRTLAARSRGAPNAALTLASALTGLIAALTADGELAAAGAVARDALPVLRRSGILLARADILASLMARSGRLSMAACLLGASDQFRADYQTARDAIEQRCRDEAITLLEAAIDAHELAALMAVGSSVSEDEIVDAIAGDPTGPAASPAPPAGRERVT